MVAELPGQSLHSVSFKSYSVGDLTMPLSTGVQFTFKDGVGIPLKYTTGVTTVASFWNAHTQLHNQYFKKASIASNTAEVVMLVPIELTVCSISFTVIPTHTCFRGRFTSCQVMKRTTLRQSRTANVAASRRLTRRRSRSGSRLKTTTTTMSNRSQQRPRCRALGRKV